MCKIVLNIIGASMNNFRTFTIPFLLLAFFLVTNCCTTKTDVADKNIVSNQLVPLSPGSAKISGNIIEIIEDGSNYLCKLKVIEVLGYGSATTPVSVGSTIMANIDNTLVSTSTQKEKYYKYKSTLKELGIVLKKRTNKRLGSKQSSSWLVVSINEK